MLYSDPEHGSSDAPKRDQELHSLMSAHSWWGSFLRPVERTCRPTSSKTTGRDSRFIISMDLSWVLALSSSIWHTDHQTRQGLILSRLW